ncbi:MAG TPA: twitch domain-containing radical SAM protein [Bacteriovoracaceae bacterium]|nr:twitch domain-containing radical SAM protein [Bacteriovoracaceae bacterium]
MKKKLNSVICPAPWSHLMMNVYGRFTSCWGAYLPSDNPDPMGSITKDVSDPIESVWNSEYLKELRKTFLNEQVPLQCKGCFVLELNGLKSDREINYPLFAKDLEERVKQTNDDGSVPVELLNSIDLQVSNFCNFSCRTCNLENSSGWAKDFFYLTKEKVHKPVRRPFETPKELVDRLKGYLKQMKWISFIGGEPLLQLEHYLILEELIKENKTDCELVYTTNLSTFEFGKYNVLPLWEKFDKINVTLSVDGLGKRGEYIREGFKWDQFLHNLKTIKSYHNITLHCNITVSLMNILELKEIVEFCLAEGISPAALKPEPVKKPIAYSITLLPQASKEKIRKDFEVQFPQDHPIREKIDGLMSYMFSEDNEAKKNQFISLTRRLDLIRNQKIEEITDILSYL